MNEINLGISSCPNDTYIFGAMLNGFIESNYKFNLTMNDVEVLNNLTINLKLDISKISFGVYPKIKDSYKILSAGGALGFANGPLIISKKYKKMDELHGKIIAIPGVNTTANLLLSELYKQYDIKKVELRFDKIIPAIINGEVDAGLIIHEGRFIYKNFNLNCLADLGEVWFNKYNLPLPLGCIVIKNELAFMAGDINKLIRSSIDFADKNYSLIEPFIKTNAYELQDTVVRSHISLYVNKYSYDMKDAFGGISKLLNMTEEVII